MCIRDRAYCVDAGSDKPTILVGGTFMFETKDGECVAPPQTAAGQPCCEIFMWQPNSGGYYYDNCSMKCATLPLLLPCRFRCLTTTDKGSDRQEPREVITWRHPHSFERHKHNIIKRSFPAVEASEASRSKSFLPVYVWIASANSCSS